MPDSNNYTYFDLLHGLTVFLGAAVPSEELAGDEFSSQVLSDYNSVDVMLDVSIDNKAWYPDLGYVAATNLNRLKNILSSEGYNVVSPELHASTCFQNAFNTL